MENIADFLDMAGFLCGWIAIILGVAGMWLIAAGAFGDAYGPADQ